jgi:hypothetical protein
MITLVEPINDTAVKPLPWQRMLWVTWRQNRPTLISVPVIFAAFGLFLLIAGLRTHHAYADLIACHPFTSNTCQSMNTVFNSTYWALGNGMNIALNLTPALVGAFAGASVLARELETGTYRYAWTQGFGRARWTIAKLTIIAVPITLVAAALSLVFTWYFQPFLRQEGLTALSDGVFVTRPLAFAGWTLTAIAIGAFAGMLTRRTLPAMAVTLGGYAGLRAFAWLVLHPHYSAGAFWLMQVIEASWLLVVSVLLGAATVRLVRRYAS